MHHTVSVQLATAAMALAALFMGACASHESKPPATALAAANKPSASSSAPLNAQPDRGTAGLVNVDQRVVAMCKLPEPQFAFDSAALNPQAQKVLQSIANCFEDGPGQGKSMNLVGHADPRGEAIYNFALGQRRAGSVASYLEHAGLPERRLATSSRGALDATGTDEATWAHDRRVDILLAN
jgi:peptidoglycan-associated lipoprotein